MPFYVKKKKNDNFMCLLEFECAKRLKAHSRAIPGFDTSMFQMILIIYHEIIAQNSGKEFVV